MADNRKWLYDALTGRGANLGTYEQYEAALSEKSNLDWLYDAAQKTRINVGTREQLYAALAPQEQPAADPLEDYRKDAEAQKAAIDKFDADNAAFFREHEHRAKMLADYGGDLPVEQEAALHNAVNESLPVYESRKALRAQMQKDYDSSPYVRLQRLDPDGTAYGDMRRAERDIETYSEQLRAAGDDDEKKRVKGLLKAAREDYYRNPIVIGTNEENARSAEGANARVEEHMRELRESHKGDEARKPGFAEQFAKAMSGVAGDSMAPQIAENYAGENEDRALAAAAESLNEDTAKIYRAPSKWGEESGWSNFWRGAAETASDIDFWTMGLSGMQDAMSLNGVFDKIRAKLGTEDLTEEKIDAALTPLEKDLYEAFCRNAMAQAERAEDMSKGYQAGASAADSLMFMAQFALTGGATEGAVKAMGKWLGKRLGVQALGKVGGLAAKGAGKVAQSAAMTLIQPTTYQGVLERVNRMEQSFPGDPSSPMRFADESGAVLKGLGDAWVENFSEMVGGPIDKVLSLPFKGAGKLARRMFGNTKFLDLAEAFYNSSAVEALKKGGWNNYAGEVGEELVGAAMRQTLGIDDQALSQFFDKDNMDIMLLSFLPTMGMGGAVNTARAGVAIRDYDKADTKYREASERLGIQPGSMENLKDAKTVGDVSAALTESIRAMMESGEKVNAEDVMSAVDLAKAAVRRRFYEDAGKLQVNGRRERDFAGLGEKYGTFWSEGGDGGRTVTRVMWDGKPGFATATDETGLMSVTFDDGTKAMLRDGDLDISGGAPVKEVMPLDAFLDKVDESRRRKSEGERVQMESNANLLKAQERLQPQTVVNIGTLDSKVAGTVQQWTPDGVVIVTEDGMSREYPWEEAQRLPLYGEDTAPEVPQVKTDAQAEEEAVEALESADERKRHYNLWRTHEVTFRDGEKDVSGTLMMARTDDDTASVKMQVRLGDGTEQEIDESQIVSVDGKTPGQVQEYGREYEDVWGREDEKAVPVWDGNAGEGDSGIGGPSSDAAVQSTGAAQERESASEPNLPLKADGSVDQKALWNSGPEAWAKWNDAARGDGGANSEAYLGAVLKQVEGEGKALAKAYAKETDFDKRDELEGRMLANAERSQKIGALLKGYADARAAAEEERKEQERKEKITARLEKERAALEANTPQTIEALAASMFSREDMRGKLDRDDFKRELGWGDAELRKFWPWWAKKGKGRSLISIAEAMPEFDDRGLIPVLGDAEQKDTQAARNAIISVFQQALSPKDVMSFTRRQNEETMERMRQEERDYVDGYFMQNYGMTADEYMASERAKDELEGTENQMPAEPLSEEESTSLMMRMEEQAVPAPEAELTPENWEREFGNGEIVSPIGKVKIGENQLAKLFLKKREGEFGMIRPTLEDPDVVLEERSSSDSAERDSSLLFVKTFIRNGEKIKHYTSVTVSKDGMEVVVSNHYMEKSALRRKLSEDAVIYSKPSLTDSSDGHLAEHLDGVPDLLPTQDNDGFSEDKSTQSSGAKQEDGGLSDFATEIYDDTLSGLPEGMKGRVTVRESSTGDEAEANFVQSYDIDGKPSGISRVELFSAELDDNPTRFIIDGSDVDAPMQEQERWQRLADEYRSQYPKANFYVADEIGICFMTFDDALKFLSWAAAEESSRNSLPSEENRPQFQTRPDDRKERQLEIINATNPMLDDYHTGIRKVGDIKTLSEAVEEAKVENGEDELSAYPDVPNGVFEEALKSGEITVYSSKPIRNGVFVTPSHMQAFDYAGYGKVYEKKVPIEDVAWINTDEGQYARVEDAGTEGAAGKYDAGQKDKEYFAALERGDMDTAQRIVNEAAERAGYAAGSGYQGTSAFNGAAPWGNGYFLTKEERKEAWDNDEFDGDQTLGDYIERGIDSMNLDFIALDPRNYRAADTERKEAIDNVRNAIQKKSKTITMYRSVPADVKEGSFRNGDWVTPSRAYAVENARIHGWGDNYNIIEQEVPVDEIWWDGNDIAEWGYGRESDYINDTDFAYKNTENNRKLLDVVTRDDNGEIIPPSKRFNASKQDERYQIAVKKKTDANSEASGLAFDAVSQMLSDAGIPVERMSDEAMRELAENANALETASVQNGHQPTVVSSASGAKVIKEIDNLIKELQNVSNYPKTILGNIAKALGAKKHGSNSQYATFEAKNGVIVTIRLANHNAATSTFDNHGEDNGISIVISARDNTGMNNDGRAHVTEYYYDAIRLRKAEGKPLAEIVKSIKQSLYSGEYKDTTGLAQVEEVNPENVPELMTGGRTPKQRWVDNYVNAVHFATGQDKKTIREGLAKKLEEARREAKELYADVLSGNFNDVTLQRIDNYIDNATDRNRFYRPLSQRLPERAVSAVSEGGRTGAVDALFSRICESTVPANERTRAEGRRKIEARKEECLEGWAKATGNWHESVADFTANTTPVDNGTDSDVYLSDDGGSVIKVSKGKFDNRKFPSDIDQVTLFNFVFPQSAYRILGYGRVDGKFVRFLEQPFVDFSESQPLTTEERVDYMGRLGFEPRNKEKTVFSNGEIVVSDLQKGNIVRSADGNIRVIDADVKLHTKDIGSTYSYPPVEADTEVPELMTVYHGSGAEFDRFDHSHMGEGEGAQAYGWGTYVTEIKGIGKSYAKKLGTRRVVYDGFEPYSSDIHNAENVINSQLYNGDFAAAKAGEMAAWAHSKVNPMYVQVLMRSTESDWKAIGGQRYLYTVEVPEDNGSNYLDWEKRINETEADILTEIDNKLYNEEGWSRVESSGLTRFTKGKETIVLNPTATGADLYEELSVGLGSPKTASEFLNSLGYVGISYPAEYMSGGRPDEARNYVIFNEADVKIVDRIEFLKSGDTVYGAAMGGKILLNEEKLNPNTPVHEYTHLWDRACRTSNLELWRRGVELMKQTSVWKEVENDPNYSGLDEDGIASEVHSRLSGDNGEAVLTRMSQEIINEGGSPIDMAAKFSVISRLKKWLSDFWHWVKDTMTPWSREEAEKVSLEDFVNMPLSDLAKGTRISVDETGGASYSIVTDANEIDRLDSAPKIKAYRAMQLVDGKLYPPMSGKVNGKWRDGIAVEDLGKVWEKADENPELADGRGLFTLNKGNGTSLKARYNPYIHTSTTPLNDQFSSAQSRPELVTVEVEIPESELTSGYRAEKAKDSVGKVEWKAGAVQGKLSGTRTVILSRWDKPVRIVPDSEVADKIVEMFDGRDITMPSNVVTPSLRAELERRGVSFVETDNQGRRVEGDGIRYRQGAFISGLESEDEVYDAFDELMETRHPLQLQSALEDYYGGAIRSASWGAKNAMQNEGLLPFPGDKYSGAEGEYHHIMFEGEDGDTFVKDVPFDTVENVEARLPEKTEVSTARFRDESLEEVNDRFNEQLVDFTAETADKTNFNLGYPSEELLLAGVADRPIRLHGSKVMKKMKKHGFSIEELRGLPKAVAHPIAVFDNLHREGNRSILTELRTANGNFLVTIDLGRGSEADFDIVSTVFGKNDKGVVDWIINGYTKYVDKEKALNYLHLSAPIAEASDKTELLSAANIVKDFENPTPSDADRRRREATESARYNASDYRRSVSSRRLAAEKTANGLGVKVRYVSRAEMPENGRHAAGYWKDGQIYVCLENNIDAEDAVKTVLHEAVGHNGLRRLVGSGNMTAFCHEMFRKLPKVEREAIARDAVRNGGNLSEAVEEHLARIAETLNPDKSYERNIWDIIRDGVRRMLAKIGIDIPLSRRDLRWLLWQSAQANRLRDPLVQARRQAMANRLGFSRMAREISGEAEDAMRFRKADEAFDADAASLYNHQVMTARERLKEVWVDQFASVETLVDAIEEKSGKKARGFEDVRLALNQQSSKGLAAMQKWEREHWNPIGESVKKIIADTGMRLEDIERYVMLKHGLERNEVFAKRDARKHYQAMHDSEVDKIRSGGWAKDVKDAAIARADAALELRLSQIEAGTDSEYLKNRETDYGGLTGMYSEFDEIAPFDPVMETEEQFLARQKRARHPKYDNVGEMERAATSEVADFETKAGESVDMLWKAVNAATKATLRHQYESNMLSRKQYEDVKGMFRYYVPLRGFKDAEASDIYDYYQSDQRNGFSAPLVHAKGRTTEAESPFGNIGAMASSAIAQDAKNDAKLAFYYFVSNRPDNGLVTISDVWYEKQYDADGNPVTDEAGRAVFKPAYPEFRDDLSAESSKEEFRKFEHEMEDKAKRGDAFKGERKLSLDYVVHIDPAQEKAHVVRVKVGGKEKMMLINGNPRASQAINGEFNMERSDGFKNGLQKWLRYISGMNTSYNPEFWISNFQRDVLFSLMSASVKEDPEYFRLFRKNLVEARKVVAMNRALQDGTLGDSATEKAYREFVDNGGVTGYTVLKKAEEWDLALKKLTGDELAAVNGVKTAFEAVQQFGESIEQMTRFAAFLTSRQQGKGIRESVSDAKELTVNFNRKGSGQVVTWKETARLRTDSGRPLNDVQRALVMGASGLSAYGRLFIMFFNAAVQGVNALYRLFRKDAKRMMMWASGYAAIGAMYAALHAMLDDDDDYLDIPDYERRNNLLIGGKGVYFKWALPQEARVFYALGDVAVNRILGREPHKAGVKGFATEIGSMIGDVLPMNFMEGERGFVPSFTIPIVESLINKDYKGSKIYNDMRYLSDEERKRTPAYQKAYRDTGKVLIDVSAALNGLTGGDYADAGWVNLNPAVIEHLIEGYTGGAGTTVEKIFKSTVGRAVGGEFSVRSTPFLSRLLTINDERYRNAHTTDLFNYYKAEAEHTRKRLRTYSRNGDDKRLDALYDSKDYEIMLIYRQYKGLMEYYADQLKLTDDKAERKRLMREQDEYRKQMIREISEIR